VWDLRNQRCLQTLQDRTTHSPEDTLSALAYSPSRKLLVSAAYSLRAWPLTDGAAGGCGHRDPVSWVGYNPMFCEVRPLQASCCDPYGIAVIARHKAHM
jgi:hypothetical protein